MMEKHEISGSAKMTDIADNVLIVGKNPDPGDDKPTHILDCVKQRHAAHEPRYGLWFDDRSLQFLESTFQNRICYV